MDFDLLHILLERFLKQIQHCCCDELEPVFTAEDAGWARDFFARQGKFSQEYVVYCKKI